MSMFSNINKLNAYLDFELLQNPNPKKPHPELTVLMDIIQANTNLIFLETNSPESRDCFAQLATKIIDYTKLSPNRRILEKKKSLEPIIWRIKTLLVHIPLSRPMTLEEHRQQRLKNEKFTKESLYSYFREKNPAQGKEILELFVQMPDFPKQLESQNEDILALLNDGILKDDPYQQLYIIHTMMRIQKFNPVDITALYQSLIPFFKVPMDPPLRSFYDSLAQISYLPHLPQAIKATEHLEREVALSFLPFLLFDSMHMPTIVQNLSNLQLSQQTAHFANDKTRYFSGRLLTVENLFTGSPEIDSVIMEFMITIYPALKSNQRISHNDLNCLVAFLGCPQGKLLLLKEPLLFLKHIDAGYITLAAIPRGSQDRANLYAALNEILKSTGFFLGPHLPEVEIMEIASHLTSLTFEFGQSTSFYVRKVLKNARELKHLKLICHFPTDVLEDLACPQELLTLEVVGYVGTLPDMSNLQNYLGDNPMWIKKIDLESRLSLVRDIYFYDTIRGTRLAIQLCCAEEFFKRIFPEHIFPDDFFGVFKNDSKNISEDCIPFIGGERFDHDALSQLYFINMFERVNPETRAILEEFLGSILESPALHLICGLLAHSQLIDVLNYWRVFSLPKLSEDATFPFQVILGNSVLKKRFGVTIEKKTIFKANIAILEKTKLMDTYVRLFSLNTYLLLNENIFTGDPIKDLEYLINQSLDKIGIQCLVRLEKSLAITFLRSPAGHQFIQSKLDRFLYKGLHRVALAELFCEAYPDGESEGTFFNEELAKAISSEKTAIESLPFDEQKKLALAPFFTYIKFEKKPVVNKFNTELLKKAIRLDALATPNFSLYGIQEWRSLSQDNPWKGLFLNYLSKLTDVNACSAEVYYEVVTNFIHDLSFFEELLKINSTLCLEFLNRTEHDPELKQRAINRIKEEIQNESRNVTIYAWLAQLFAEDDPMYQIIKSTIAQYDMIGLFEVLAPAQKIKMFIVGFHWPDFPIRDLNAYAHGTRWFSTLNNDDLALIYDYIEPEYQQNILSDIVTKIWNSAGLFSDGILGWLQKHALKIIDFIIKKNFFGFPNNWQRLYDVLLRSIFNGTPLKPDVSRKYAQIALRQHIFDQDDNMMALMITLAEDDPVLAGRPYCIYKKHKDAQHVPTLVRPPYFNIAGTQAALSLEGLQDSFKAMAVHKNQIPRNASVVNWTKLRDGLKNKIDSSKTLQNEYSDFDSLWHNGISRSIYETLLNFSSDGDLVSPPKAQWTAIVAYLLSLDSTSVDEDHLSPQEAQLYRCAYALTACDSGSRQGVAHTYSQLPPQFKYSAKGLEIGTESQMRAKFQITPLIGERIQSFLVRDQRMLRELVQTDRGQIYLDDVHDIEYLKNSVQWLLGLGTFLIFDWHAREMKLTRDQILSIVLKHLSPIILIEVLKEASVVPIQSKWESGEEPLGVLMGECISTSPALWDYNEEGTGVLNDRGGLELLRYLGIVNISDAHIITNWKEELAFVVKEMALYRQLQREPKADLEGEYVNALTKIIYSRLAEAHPLSILILNEQKNELYKLLSPTENRKAQFEKLFSDRINFVTVEMLHTFVDGPDLLTTLKFMPDFEHVLPAKTKKFFLEKIMSREFNERRWEAFKRKLTEYQVSLEQSETFAIEPFKRFCSEAHLLLPPGDLFGYEGYLGIIKQLESVITIIVENSGETHVLSFQEAKKLYDPLIERFGQAFMEFNFVNH